MTRSLRALVGEGVTVPLDDLDYAKLKKLAELKSWPIRDYARVLLMRAIRSERFAKTSPMASRAMRKGGRHICQHTAGLALERDACGCVWHDDGWFCGAVVKACEEHAGGAR